MSCGLAEIERVCLHINITLVAEPVPGPRRRLLLVRQLRLSGAAQVSQPVKKRVPSCRCTECLDWQFNKYLDVRLPGIVLSATLARPPLQWLLPACGTPRPQMLLRRHAQEQPSATVLLRSSVSGGSGSRSACARPSRRSLRCLRRGQ